MTEPRAAQLEAGRRAFRAGDAPEARRAFEAALAESESGEAFEGLARALYLAGDYHASIAAHQRACSAYRREHDTLGAARVARMLAWLHTNLYGDTAVAGGWFERACGFLEEAGLDSVERGWIELIRATLNPDMLSREDGYRRALAIARQFGDLDLEFEALGWVGLVLVYGGRTGEGMPLLDQALAAVCAGEVEDLFVAEGVFCGMFWACEIAHDVPRAEQWMRMADDFASRRSVTAVGAFCRAHYGSILTAAGRWTEAEATLLEAVRQFDRGYRAMRADVLVRLADLRVRQGRIEEAEQLLAGLDQHPDAVRPLVALYLARGELVLAGDLLERALSQTGAGPEAGPLLALAVDLHLARGAPNEAARAADALTSLAQQHSSGYLRGSAALARGKVCLASGKADARACLNEALTAFSSAQMPAELAWARFELARAIASERPEVAVTEARAALTTFERLPAPRGADAAAALLRSLGVAGRSAARTGAVLTAREVEVLELLGLGLSNAEIAERLIISAKTVEHHVGRILSKLGLRNRAEAAAYAMRRPSGDRFG
jgi:DNA-binding CsgD family transcriptional regulator